ncbi:MAG: carboxypeptidase-like regulatory domain-containing protein [Terriglobales bacterium]
MSRSGRKLGLPLLLLLGLAAAAQQAPKLGRSVHGVVLDALGQPLSSAIVYLKNTQTKVIHTVITDANGAYSFHQLQANVTYQLYAQWKGHKSNLRVDSQYLMREDLNLNLKIPVG